MAINRLPRVVLDERHPRFMREEKGTRKTYPYELILQERSRRFTARYRKSQWQPLDYHPELVLRKREVFCWIYDHQAMIAALQLFEYESQPYVYNEEFFESMDAESSIEMDLAKALCDGWAEFVQDVLAFGNLVDFRMAWTDPSAFAPGVWATAATSILTGEFGNRAILTMKAFPLAYEGRVNESENTKIGFLRKRNAMIRYYRKLFDVNPFPGVHGEDGWLFSIASCLEDIIDCPSIPAHR